MNYYTISSQHFGVHVKVSWTTICPCSGLVTGTYTTSGSEACYFTAHYAKANVIVVEDHIQLHKILEVRMHGSVSINLRCYVLGLQVSNRLPHLKALVQYTGQLDQKSTNIYDVSVSTWMFIHELCRWRLSMVFHVYSGSPFWSWEETWKMVWLKRWSKHRDPSSVLWLCIRWVTSIEDQYVLETWRSAYRLAGNAWYRMNVSAWNLMSKDRNWHDDIQVMRELSGSLHNMIIGIPYSGKIWRALNLVKWPKMAVSWYIE